MTEIPRSVPNPDPTERTTEVLLRAVASLKDVVDRQFDVVDERFKGMDKAVDLLQKATDKFPGFVKEQVAQLKDVHNEQFRTVQLQFESYEKLLNQTSVSSTTAINAALQAQKESANQQNIAFDRAATKAETTTNNEIGGIKLLISSITKAADEKIGGLDGRITRIESIGVGKVTAETAQKESSGSFVAIIAVSVSVLAMIASVVIALAVKG